MRVHAAAVNPTDTLLRAGLRADVMSPALTPPYIPGMDVAGVVDEVGAGADHAVGDRVVGLMVPNVSGGAYAEYVVLDTRSVARAPAGASAEQAATLPMNAMTARSALDQLGLRPGQTLLVTGGAGATGGYTIQLANAEGLRVIADAVPKDVELLRSLGADEVLPRGPGLPDAVRSLVREGVDGALDAALIGQPVLAAIRTGGGLATVRDVDGPPERGITLHPSAVAERATERAKLDRLVHQAETGVLTLRVAAVYPCTAASAAHRRLEAGGTRGRLVLKFASPESWTG